MLGSSLIFYLVVRIKSYLVGGVYMTDTPPTITYQSVVSCETLRIALTISALNDLEFKVLDIGNGYVNAPGKENI